MIELKHDRVGFTTIHTRVSAKVFVNSLSVILNDPLITFRNTPNVFVFMGFVPSVLYARLAVTALSLQPIPLGFIGRKLRFGFPLVAIRAILRHCTCQRKQNGRSARQPEL